jgi:Arc-like DNA binding domain
MADSDIKQFALRLPVELLEQVDARAEKLRISRNQWYENMTRWVLVNTYTTDEGIRLAQEKAHGS